MLAEPTACRGGPIRGTTISANLFPLSGTTELARRLGHARSRLSVDSPARGLSAGCPASRRGQRLDSPAPGMRGTGRAAGLASVPESERHTVFAAVLLHDVAKPDCTRTEPDDRITAPGHSRRGAILARQILWRLGMPFRSASRWPLWCATIRRRFTCSAMPIVCAKRSPLARRLAAICSPWSPRPTRAAASPPISHACWRTSRCLRSIAANTAVMTGHDRLPATMRVSSTSATNAVIPTALPTTIAAPEVVVLSGFPGVGKNHWIANHLPDWPVIGLDDIRRELDIEPTEAQGTVLNHARELARAYLRQGRSFVWNATNLSRQVRGNWARAVRGLQGAHAHRLFGGAGDGAAAAKQAAGACGAGGGDRAACWIAGRCPT